jgi:hypothetical protein
MGQQPVEGSAGEMMIVGLIDHADRIGKSAQSAQHALTEQIQELSQLQQWAANAALDLQKRTDAAIQKLEAERAQWQNARTGIERNAVQAIRLFRMRCGSRAARSNGRQSGSRIMRATRLWFTAIPRRLSSALTRR